MWIGSVFVAFFFLFLSNVKKGKFTSLNDNETIFIHFHQQQTKTRTIDDRFSAALHM